MTEIVPVEQGAAERVLRLSSTLADIRRTVHPLTQQGEDHIWRSAERACSLLDKAEEQLAAIASWNTRATLTPKVEVEHPVFAYLLGEGDLEGFWFGDPNPDERGAFWWRKHLREALTSPAKVEEGVERDKLRRRIAAARMLLGMQLQARYVDRDGDWSISGLFNDLEALLAASPSGERDAGLEEAATFLEYRAAQFGDSFTAQTMAAIFRDEATAIRSLKGPRHG